jgi:hypothetical protein
MRYLDRVLGDKLVVPLRCRIYEREQVGRRTAKTKDALLHAISFEADFAETGSVTSKPPKQREPPLFER